MRVTIACLVCFLGLLLGGCFERETPAGIVATVNDKPILLKTIQAMQEADMVDFGIFEQFTLLELRAQYGKTLANLIVYEMMLQELEAIGFIITDAMLKEFEDNIRKDYPEGEFEKYFEENSIDINSWREVVRYIVALQEFTAKVLRKDFVPSLEDVQAYFEEHKDDFNMPASYELYVATSEKKEALAGMATMQEFLEKKSQLDTYNMRVEKESVPDEWKKNVLTLKENMCTPVFKDEDMFTVVCLESFTEAKSLSPSEAYIYIEEFLAEEQLIHVFDQWLKTKIPQTRIKISTHVVHDIK